jgi:hypothetical protein
VGLGGPRVNWRLRSLVHYVSRRFVKRNLTEKERQSMKIEHIAGMGGGIETATSQQSYRCIGTSLPPPLLRDIPRNEMQRSVSALLCASVGRETAESTGSTDCCVSSSRYFRAALPSQRWLRSIPHSFCNSNRGLRNTYAAKACPQLKSWHGRINL